MTWCGTLVVHGWVVGKGVELTRENSADLGIPFMGTKLTWDDSTDLVRKDGMGTELSRDNSSDFVVSSFMRTELTQSTSSDTVAVSRTGAKLT